MFCNNCGKEIADGSKFCNYCGTKIALPNNDESAPKENNNQNQNYIPDDDKGGCLKGVLVFVGVIIGLVLLSIALVKIVNNFDSSGNIVDKLVERDITKSDFDVSTSEGVTSYTITITPKVKMNECHVEIKLLDSKGNVVHSDTITKTDLKEGSSYSYKFEYNLTTALSAKKISYSVTGKCIG